MAGELAIATTPGELKTFLNSSQAIKRMRDAMANNVTPDQIVSTMMATYSRTPAIQECTLNSYLYCCVCAAELGLVFTPALGQAYMVPFNNRKLGAKEAQFIPGYRGLITLARRTGSIRDIGAHVVYSNDRFSVSLGSDPKIDHVPKLVGPRGDRVCVYAYALLSGSDRPHFEVMTAEEVEKIKKFSKSSQFSDSMWQQWEDEAWKKSVLRRLVKYLPMQVDDPLAKGVERDQDIDFDFAPPEREPQDEETRNKAGALLKRLKESPTTAPAEPPPAVVPETLGFGGGN